MIRQPLRIVSAIVPARNEEINIAGSVRSIAAQPEIREIIVVDDQSDDRTGEILRELEREFPALRILRVEDLPAGWLGKPHALAMGARLATGDWLLFTDADTGHRPGSLGAALNRADEQQADLFSLSPGQKLETWWERSIIPLIFVQLSALYPFAKVNDPSSPIAAANGQYILIRRATYESVGGHAAAPAAVLEDVALTRSVKSAGGRVIFQPGAGWAETRMYRTFTDMWSGWTKNLFLLYRSDPGGIRKTVFYLMVPWLLGFASIIVSALLLRSGIAPTAPYLSQELVLWLALFAAVVVAQLGYRRTLIKCGFSPRLAKYFFIGAPLLSLLLLNSLRAYQRSGLIQWKGRTYSVGQPQ
jgi:chlorobactene glucosyltransferase